ncbi:hypothetical protein [Pyruvatibacter sp.]|uniref:hypothetical protein n=1 Tax=Pyruvatibacter sp. TaxID=1981328 RepID=UPI0032EADA6E
MNEINNQLPDLLARIADAVGEEAALLVAKEWGGRRLYIPQHVPPGHRLVQVLGRPRAEKVVETLGYGQVVVPLGPEADGAARRAMIRQLLDEGVSQHTIARRVRVHIRTVEREAQRCRAAQQPNLFG